LSPSLGKGGGMIGFEGVSPLQSTPLEKEGELYGRKALPLFNAPLVSLSLKGEVEEF